MKSTSCWIFPALACSLFLSIAAFAQGTGAVTPFTSYEAEAGTLGKGATIVSLTAPPTTQYSSPALEASGHAYVQLTGTGQSVQWTNNTGQPITFINLRESIPDAPTGGGITATLDLYVNGVFRQALNLNSRQSWLYEGNNNYGGNDQNPADGDPRVFYDESHTFITGAPIAPGSTFSLQKDSSNTAAFYDIDVIDVENPPAPLTQPPNSISITSCGAVADNNPTNGSADPAAVDSTAAIQNCINQAEAQGKILWIPQGTFYLIGTTGLQAQGITIAGAGMWYSTIYREIPLPNSVPLAAAFSVTSCTVQNFHIDSNAVSRATVDGGGGAMDTTGTNWLANNMWNQHVESGFWASGTGGKVENSRLTSIWADGCNLNNVSLNTSVGNNLTATNNFIRGTGDDAMAINSVAYNNTANGTVYYTAMSNITETNNTLIAPWGGKGIGVYGGSGHLVSNNYISDTARYIGLGVGRFGVNGSDLHTSTVSNNVVVRSGGNAYSQGQPALQIGNGGDGQNVGIVDGMTVQGNTVINSVYDGIGFSTSTNTLLENNTVTSPWRNGIAIDPPFYPAPSGSATITGNTATGLKAGNSAFINNSSGFVATLSGNSWQASTPEAPYGGTPAPIPGTVLAENYDTGGQAVAYSVASVNGTNNSYRSDGVDLETTSAPGGGNDLGWTATGQWFRYTVNVATAGTYTLTFEVASPNGVTDGFHLANSSGTNLTGSVNVPATGGWQTWTTVTANVTLPAGEQVLVLNEDNAGWNIDSGAFALTNATCTASAPVAPTGVSATATSSSQINLSWTASATSGVTYSVFSSTTSGLIPSTSNQVASGLSGTTYSSTGLAASTTHYYIVEAVNCAGSAAASQVSTTTLSGSTPTPPQLSPSSLSFGYQLTGTVSAAQVITLTNPAGSATLTISSIAASAGFAETNNCSNTLAAGASCTISVTFAPTGGGPATGSLSISNSTASTPVNVSLVGTGYTSTTNFALGATVTASSSEAGYPASNVNDGNTSTYWESLDGSGYPQTITLNFGHVLPLGLVELFLPPPSSWATRTETFSVLGSVDGSTYTTLVASQNYTFNPATGNTVSFNLPAGISEQYLRLVFTANTGWNAAQLSEFEVFPGTTNAPSEGPYAGTPAAVPGMVLAENYDTGGQGVGYSVTSTNGTTNAYRSDGVDLETTSNPGGGNDLGWTAPGQWFRYMVNVATAGTYTVTFAVASPNGVTDGFHLSNSSGTNLTGSVSVPETGGWQTWTTVTSTVTLPAGLQVLTINQDNAAWNIYSMAFAFQ